ncbi:MAG: hypothetical protein V4510_10825 [bacterium]
MTDWLPWGAVVMAGVFGTLATLLRRLGRTPIGAKPDLRAVWWALAISAAAGVGVYALYVAMGEDWVWYLRR